MNGQHESRRAPKCVDCEHMRYGPYGHACGHPQAPVSVVTGNPAWRAEKMRAEGYACGVRGALFSAADGKQS